MTRVLLCATVLLASGCVETPHYTRQSYGMGETIYCPTGSTLIALRHVTGYPEAVNGGLREEAWHQETLTYKGMVPGTEKTARIQYASESSDGPPESMEVAYNLAAAMSITFRTFHLEVLEATGDYLRVRVLEDGVHPAAAPRPSQ